MNWEALWSQYSVKVKMFRQKLNHGGIRLAKEFCYHFNMHILHVYSENYISLEDTMCKNDDACLKIPNKYNNLSKYKYTYKNNYTNNYFPRENSFPSNSRLASIGLSSF